MFTYGHRPQQATNIFSLAGCLAVTGRIDPAAVLVGWAESIYTLYAAQALLTLSADAAAAISALLRPCDSQYVALKARGAAMSDEEVLRYAEEQLTSLPK
jgi:hypothetical protein